MKRIFFCSDVHGSEGCYRKFVNTSKHYKCDVLILAGDLLGKAIVPMIQEGQKYRCNFLGEEWVLEADELASFERRVRDGGQYPYHLTHEEKTELDNNPGRVEQVFGEMYKEQIKQWMRFAEDKLRGTGTQVYVMPGNDDSFVIDDVIRESDVVVNPEGQVIELGEGFEMISCGRANVTPWKCPRDVSEEDLAELLERSAVKLKNVSTSVFNFHAPPHNSTLDIAPVLDYSVSPPSVKTTKIGEVIVENVGSVAVRKAIEKYQPLIGLHGHIHESKGIVNIGRTLCINAGSEYSEGILKGAIIVLEKQKIKTYQLTSG